MDFSKMIITNVSNVSRRNTEKGTKNAMKDRPYYGLVFKFFGKTEFIQNDKTYISSPENVLFLPKNSSYHYKTLIDSDSVIINFDIQNQELTNNEIIQLNLSENAYNRIINILNEITNENEKILDNNFLLMSNVYKILNELFRNSYQAKNTLTPCLKFIEKNIENPNITNELLANEIGYSEIYLRKLFKKIYNTTPAKFVSDYRIKIAKILLIENELSIASIAEKTGFTSIYSFSRAFKFATNQTPSEFKKSNINI